MDRDLASTPDLAPTGKTQVLSKNECVLLLPQLKSSFSTSEYLPCFQSSAARPQAPAEKLCNRLADDSCPRIFLAIHACVACLRRQCICCRPLFRDVQNASPCSTDAPYSAYPLVHDQAVMRQPFAPLCSTMVRDAPLSFVGLPFSLNENSVGTTT